MENKKILKTPFEVSQIATPSELSGESLVQPSRFMNDSLSALNVRGLVWPRADELNVTLLEFFCVHQQNECMGHSYVY